MKENKQSAREIKPRPRRRYTYHKKRRNTSIYFLVWAIFTVFSLLIGVIFGVSQHVLMTQTYREEASREIAEKGKRIQQAVATLPKEFGGNYSGYIRFLAKQNEVEVYILSADGKLLFPQESHFDPENPSIQEVLDYSSEMTELLEVMDKRDSKEVIYESDGGYIYGAEVSLFSNKIQYLYVRQSIQLMLATNSKLGERGLLIGIFVFVLAFAVSSVLSSWLTKPLSEMTEKANRLARGDFNVDFNGADYGQEMVELAKNLNYARDELSKTDRMQKELIANVSHDFKTPLTMIKAYSSMIMEISGDIPEKRNRHAQVIIDETDRLASLVNDVLDLSKIRSGIEELKWTHLDMSAYTFEVLGRFAYLQEVQGYTFLTDVDEDLYTYADELKIGQVLYNLIGNAVNYTGKDKTVRVQLKKTGKGVFRFSVTDTGKGIKTEEISAVWDRYYRSSEMHKRPVKGMGLGLSIVKTILEKHNFHFGLETEVGKGTTFFVDFPLLEEDNVQ